MKILKYIITWAVWIVVGLYAVTMTAIHIPAIQQWLGQEVAQAISEKIGSKVNVGRVDLGFLNRLIVDDLTIYDQQQKRMVDASRITVKIDFAPLAVGRIAISSAQIFGAHLKLSRQTADSPINFQFLLDSLASKDTTSQTPLDLHINSFIMRHSSISYDQEDASKTHGKFNPKHLFVNNISAYVILKVLNEDSLNVNVKRLTCKETSGLDIQKLSFKLTANSRNACLQNFLMQMPNSRLCLDSVTATYDANHLKESLQFQGNITKTHIAPSDFACFYDRLKDDSHKLTLMTSFDYKDDKLTIPSLVLESDKRDVSLLASGHYKQAAYGKDTWLLNVSRVAINEEAIGFVSKNITTLPDEVIRLGNILLRGEFSSDAEGTLNAQANVTTDAGKTDFKLLLKEDKQFAGSVMTEGIDVGKILENNKLGIVAANIDVSGIVDKQIAASGQIEKLELDGYNYQNISLDASYGSSELKGWIQIDDPRVEARLETALKGTNINNAVGTITLSDLSLPEKDYRLDNLHIASGFEETRRFVTLDSDFAHADLSGVFDFTNIVQSIANVIGSHFPTLPGLPKLTKPTKNNFAFQMTLNKTDWLQKLLGIDIDIKNPMEFSATVNDQAKLIRLNLQAPAFTYNDKMYRNGDIQISSPKDTLYLNAAIKSENEEHELFDLSLGGNAVNNNLMLTLKWDNNDAEHPLNGTINATSHLYKNFDDRPEAHVNILPSNVFIENSVWQIEPSDILYSTDRLLIDHFSVHNRDQYIRIDGTASTHKGDSVFVDLNDVEVAYILDLVDFDAVTFSGLASGRAVLTSVFSDPGAYANLTVNNFKFQDGRMGTLLANVDWNQQDKQIDIHATANDGLDAMTFINGYVSIEKEYIDLGLSARGTYLDFMHSFTEDFISHITGHGTGDLRLAGPLSAINLTGNLVVDGEATITPLNTTYQLRNDSITFVYNEILLDSLTIYDKYDNIAYLSGGVHHKDLTNLSLDLHVDTDQLLGYDFTDFGDQSFYGTVFASGAVDIVLKGNDVNINCNVTPLKNSVFVYNAAQTDAISSQEFITWKAPSSQKSANPTSQPPSTTNIYMNFLVNATPEGTLRLLMDAKTGDYITLNGNGVLQASYYNKGTFQMQGTYTVESGTYDVTIQNIINKKFQFQPGGTIVFGGDPYSAALNLQALYTVNGVSLSDLNIGNSFSSNTVRVNCLMNIGGQPSAPQVTFDLDMPTVNADEKQMVRSLLSSQQEMNQQVLYLLGIGRFYNLEQNNSNQQQQQGQTSLAMQSFLSGTLSTQINNVINQIVKNDDWNFGANISTGTEGWNNAEYEGIVNGRMLNNRLLINGQFGYRDNATQATPSFIGDFDVSYLLLPSGNIALKVYNQTNDRYFTRSSLNTQGLGIIMKKDFNGFNDFFGIKKKDK